jgi:hypothetical protein
VFFPLDRAKETAPCPANARQTTLCNQALKPETGLQSAVSEPRRVQTWLRQRLAQTATHGGLLTGLYTATFCIRASFGVTLMLLSAYLTASSGMYGLVIALAPLSELVAPGRRRQRPLRAPPDPVERARLGRDQRGRTRVHGAILAHLAFNVLTASRPP